MGARTRLHRRFQLPAATCLLPTTSRNRKTSWLVDKPMARTDANSVLAHQQLLEKKTKGKIDVYFVGNSITRRWGCHAITRTSRTGRRTSSDGMPPTLLGARTRSRTCSWRMENGELDGVNPKVIVILAGTNNVGTKPGTDEKVADITRGLKALIDLSRSKAPNATIIVTGIFPRNDNIAVVPWRSIASPRTSRDSPMGRAFATSTWNDGKAGVDADGVLFERMTVDKLHPTVKGYQIWADALKPVLREILGAPAATDSAPPPTGDPSARVP